MTLGLASVVLAPPLPGRPPEPQPRGPLARPCVCGSWIGAQELTWSAIEAAVRLHVAGSVHISWATRQGFR